MVWSLLVDDVALGDDFEPLRFMVEPIGLVDAYGDGSCDMVSWR